MGNKCAPSSGEYQPITDEENIPVAVAVETANSCDVLQMGVAQATTAPESGYHPDFEPRDATHYASAHEDDLRRLQEDKDTCACFLILCIIIYLIICLR